MSVNFNEKIFKYRRVLLVLISLLFLLQVFGVSIITGYLVGSAFLHTLNFLDPFSFVEVLLASRELTSVLLISLIPVILIYIIFGRSFCGWLCPLDWVFEMIASLKRVKKKRESKVIKYALTNGGSLRNEKYSYIPLGVVSLILILDYLFKVPIFSRYISHLTNVFRLAVSNSYLSFNIFVFSFLVLFTLFLIEFFFPRLWCRYICPVGIVYGTFNRISLIKLKFERVDQCTFCHLCAERCYMKVDLMSKIERLKAGEDERSTLRSSSCIYCGECVRSCPHSIIKVSLK
jgi:ferredoxin-type protein NapH